MTSARARRPGHDTQEDEAAMADPTPEEKAAQEAAAAEAAKAKAEEEAAAKKAEEDAALGEGGKAALEKERTARKEADTARKAAEKAAREAQAKLDALEAEKLTETEKLQKEAEEGKALAATATDKLRRATLIAELSKKDHGIADARAAAKLIEGVEFDDNDEPTNLPDRVKALIEEYPLLKGRGQRAPDLNENEGREEGDKPNLTAEQLASAKSFGMTAEEYVKYMDPSVQPEPAKT